MTTLKSNILNHIDVNFPPAKSHIHWLLWAYEKKAPKDDGGFLYHSNVPIDVIARSYTEALERAKLLCPLEARYSTDSRQLLHAGYDIMSVIEHLEGACTHEH